jgi:hypothetical protein
MKAFVAVLGLLALCVYASAGTNSLPLNRLDRSSDELQMEL